MPQHGNTLIMKFGGASVAEPSHFSRLADLIIQKLAVYPKIAVVVSAMGDMTDQLIDLAHQVNPNPPERECDMLVSVGERISISLLAMALAAKGVDAVSFTGSQSGIVTSCEHGKAQIVEVRPGRLLPHLLEGKVVIVAGFQGVSLKKEITTLGRGGSDTSAVALGVALEAECVTFYKDVEGIYPKKGKRVCAALTYDEALAIVAKTGHVLHPRALRLAKKHALRLHVRSFQTDGSSGTWIGK